MKRNNIPVFSATLANKLLSNGHHIVQVCPNKTEKHKTVFFFKPDTSILSDIAVYTKERKTVQQ